nr:hypothetical protein [Tanacetum cinerariifolium]
MATSERAERLLALDTFAVCLPFAEAFSLGLAAVVGGVMDVSELLLVLLTLALGLGAASPQSTELLRVLVSGYQIDYGEHNVIPDIVLQPSEACSRRISQPSGLGVDKGTGSKPRVPDVPTDESKEELSWNSTDDEGDHNEGKNDDDDAEDEGDDGEEGNSDDDDEDDDGKEGDDDDVDQEVEEGDDDDVDQEVVRDDDKDDDEEDSKDEGGGEEDLNLNIGEEERHDEEEEEDELNRDVNINHGRGLLVSLEVEDSHVTLTSAKPDGQQESSSVSSQFMISLLNLTLDTNQFAGAVSAIPGIVQHYMDQRMNEVVKVAVQIQSDQLREEAQRENDEFLRTVDENIKKIIKEQVKEQVKAQVYKIFPRIEQAVNEQLEAEVLTRSSHSSRTSYAVAAESDKIILDTYGETVTLKRRRDDDEDKVEEPSAGPDRGSKRRKEGKEPESASAPM